MHFSPILIVYLVLLAKHGWAVSWSGTWVPSPWSTTTVGGGLDPERTTPGNSRSRYCWCTSKFKIAKICINSTGRKRSELWEAQKNEAKEIFEWDTEVEDAAKRYEKCEYSKHKWISAHFTHTAQLHKKIRNAIYSKRRWGRKIKQDHNGLERSLNFEWATINVCLAGMTTCKSN